VIPGREQRSFLIIAMKTRNHNVLAYLLLTILAFVFGSIRLYATPQVEQSATQQEISEKVWEVFSNSSAVRDTALSWHRARKNPDVIAPLIYALRYSPDGREEIADTLRALSGASYAPDWFQWMLWQQSHPEIKPFAGFDTFQADLFANIDPNFRVFIYPGVKHEIRLEEIAWGGVIKDGIPALINPELIPANEAEYLTDSEPVFGIEINGDVRAYPYRIMDWHEMFNDVIGGVPVALAYCTLCGSGILFDTQVEGHGAPFVFGSSGFLYRSNKLMYDKESHSLWNQFTGRPVVGELAGADIELKVLPVVTTTWHDWYTQHPDTKVLSLNTGHQRDYTPGRPYSNYFTSPDLMFPTLVPDKRLQQKDQVFGLRITGVEKAWPLKTFKGGRVINDRVGVIDLVLVGDADKRTVRAYRSGGRKFRKKDDGLKQLVAEDGTWTVTETGLVKLDGQSLSRLPGHLAYWFAWSGYLEDAEFWTE